MFNFSSSSEDGASTKYRTKTITLAYADASCLVNEDTSISEEYTSSSSSSLATPTTLGSAVTLLDKLEEDRKKEQVFGYHPIWRDMSMSEGIKLKTLEYLWDSKIFQLFNFLMTHLLTNTPEDPVPFLIDLVNCCIRYRDEDGEPPLVFADDHINSVYVSLDPLEEGSITYKQYLAGMQILGLTEFNILPDEGDYRQNMAKDVFVQQAKNALIKQLNLILGKGRDSRDSVIENVVNYENGTLDSELVDKK